MWEIPLHHPYLFIYYLNLLISNINIQLVRVKNQLRLAVFISETTCTYLDKQKPNCLMCFMLHLTLLILPDLLV